MHPGGFVPERRSDVPKDFSSNTEGPKQSVNPEFDGLHVAVGASTFWNHSLQCPLHKHQNQILAQEVATQT